MILLLILMFTWIMANIVGFAHHYGVSFTLKIKLPIWLSYFLFIRLSEDGYCIWGIILKFTTLAAALMMLARLLVSYPNMQYIYATALFGYELLIPIAIIELIIKAYKFLKSLKD